MKKKILAVLLVLCAVVLFALTASAATDTSVGYRVNVTLSADSYFCGTEGHTGEVTSISIKNVDSSKWDTSETRPLTVLFEVSFKCNTCGVSGTKIANNALSLTFRDANSCHAPFNASVTARNLLSGRDDSITFTLTRDKIGYAEKVEKKDATCTESGISQTCWECQGCKQIFSDENCTNKLANDISGVTIPASGHSLTHYEAQDANCQHDGWVEHWRCEKCNGYFLDAAGLNPTGSSSVMRYDRNKHVGETVYVPYNLEGKRNHKVYPSCHPGIFTTEPHVLGDSSKGEDPDCCALCGQIVAAKVLHSVDPYEKRFFAHDDAIADFNNSETSEEIHFLRSFDRTVSINKAGTVRLAEGKYITYMNVGDYDVTIWNDGKITNLNAYSSTTLRGSKTGTYGKITNRTEGGTVGDLLFGYTSNWAYYVTEDSRWISRAAANDSSISNVRVLYSPFTYIEITGDGVKEATDEADKYTLTAIRGDTVTLDVATYAVFPSMSADSSITWDYGGIPEDRVSVVRNVDWKDLRLTITDLPSGTYTLTFTRTAVNKFSVSATLVLTVEETLTAHTVTFDPNGGTLNEDEKSKSVMPGDAYGALPTPTRDSHHFSGWYTAPVGGTKVDETTVVTELEDHTLYAHWTYYHEHCVCGGTLNHTHENVEWQAWDGKSEIAYEGKWIPISATGSLWYKVAYVYLTDDVTANLTISGRTILHLCLNGYSFTCADPSQPAITLTSEEGWPAKLDLCDCADTGTLGGASVSGGSVHATWAEINLYGGTLTGNNATGNGGAVYLSNSSFTMHGGAIRNNTASNGGGIYAGSKGETVNINGGIISGNRATNGGGIYASSGAKFHLNGGEIQNNVATEAGGGVYCSNLYSQNTGLCEFYGGTISGNTAKQGGGAYVRVCYIGYRNCRITDNTAAEAGGGLYLFPFASAKRIYMGNVYGSSGTIAPYIYDNTVNSAQNNLYLSDPDTQIVFTARINTDADAKLGVYFTGITQNGASVLLNSLLIEKDFQAKMYLDRIFCDNPEYGHLEMQNDNGYYNLYLINTASAVKVTFDPNGGTLNAGEESKLVQPDSPYGSLPTPTRADYRFDGWFTEKDGGTKVEETTIMSSRAAHTLYAHWTFLHEHCICGGDTAAGDHTAHTAQTFTAWNGTDAISYTNKTAYVYLSQNVTINSNLVVDGATLYLCLNGKTFASNGTNKITVNNGGRLVLCDCAGGGTIRGATKKVWGGSCVYLYQSTLDIFGGTITGGKVTGKGGGGAIALDDSKCVLNIYGGEISGNNGNKSGGAIFLNKTDNKGGTVNMYGGTIANNTAQKGGVIYSECGGTINLAGGTISGNKATNGDGGVINMAGGTVTISGAKLTGNTSSQYGGAVYLYNGVTATMTGGEISSNQAASEGGAVHVYGTSTFNLSGGKITGNSSVDGGAIYLNREPSVLNMSGGVISGNTATGNGGGVYIYRSGSICNLSGGTIENNTAGSGGGGIYVNPKNSGQLKLSGAPTVRNNTVSGAANNVYLPSGKTLSISAPMEPGASVGVTVGNASYPVAFSNAYEEDYAAYFSSDDANAQVAYRRDQILYLVTADSRTVLERTMSINNAKVEKYYDGTPDFPVTNFGAPYKAGDFTLEFKDGTGCTISAVFDSPEAGDSKTVTVTVTLTGENAEQFVFENGTTTDTFTIGGTIHKAEPDLELSMLKTEFLKGDSLYETLSVTGVMENAEVTYRYAEHPSLIYADNDSNNEVIYSFTQAVDAGEFWAYATTAETANYRAGRSNAVKFTVLDFCTVHFESNGALMPRKVPWGRAYGELPVLSREGYTFDGWFTEAEGGTQIQATDIMPENTEEQTLYAHWTPLHTHVFDQQVQNDETLKTPADCLNDAVYYLSCECGEISTSDTFSAADTALGHDWGAWTSSENGQHQRTCSRDSSHVEKEACSYSSEWKQDRYNHWHVCEICGAAQEKAGHFDSDNDHKCDACGAKTSEHDPSAEKADDKYLKSAATCTAKAVYYKSCAICGEKGTETFEYGEKDPDNHTGVLSDWQHDGENHWKVYSCCQAEAERAAHHGGTASCTKKAVCEDCGGEYGNLLPHNFTAETAEDKYLKSAATCTEKAVYYKSCTVCGEKGTETFEYGNPLGHDYGAWTSNDNGTHTRVCSRDASHAETDDCHGGTASCTKKAVCEDCKAEYGDLLPHDFAAEQAEEKYLKSAATCTEKAVYYKYCTVCGEKGTETFEYGNPLGHDYGAWTSNDNGTHTRVCSRDANHTETDDCHGGTASCTKKAVCEDCKAEYGDLLPHDFAAEQAEEKYLKSAATCTEKAVYYKYCTVCGEKGTETFEYGNPLGHDYGAWTSNDNGTHTRVCSRDAIHTETENCSGGEATCTEQATCEFCGKKYGEPLGHTYKPEWITNEQRHWHVCASCDHIKDMGVHRFGEWSIVRRPTSTKTGERVRSCTICNYEETEELTVTGGYVLPYYKLMFETNGGSSLEPVVKIKGTVIDLAEYSAYRYGYTFDGWYADEALTQRVTSVTLDADKTVYAAWTRNRFFEDVTIADWFYDDVMFVCGRGVMQGVSDTRFGPHLTATRAMMATILWRMEGSPAPTAEARFTDVRSGQWYSEAVAWTAQSGVYTGYADGSFRPNDSITREQLAAILYRYAKYKGVDVSVGEDTNILSYADAAEISDYAFPAMQWACGAGVMQGSNGNLLPRGRATRAQIAAMLHRYLVK